jgi:hypothetical protein
MGISRCGGFHRSEIEHVDARGRHVTDLGPTRALTVTFWIPVFAMIQGALFLAETTTAARVVVL